MNIANFVKVLRLADKLCCATPTHFITDIFLKKYASIARGLRWWNGGENKYYIQHSSNILLPLNSGVIGVNFVACVRCQNWSGSLWFKLIGFITRLKCSECEDHATLQSFITAHETIFSLELC